MPVQGHQESVDSRVAIRRQYIADAFGSSCAFAQVRHTSTALIKRFGLEHEHLPKVVALTRVQEDGALFFVEHTGTICLEDIGEFLRKVRQGMDDAEVLSEGPVYLDGRKRNVRWGDEHRDKNVDQGIRDRIILARYCRQNIAVEINSEMDAVVRQLNGLRAGWIIPALISPSVVDHCIVNLLITWFRAERFLLSSLNRDYEQTLDLIGRLRIHEVLPLERKVAGFQKQVSVSHLSISLRAIPLWIGDLL